METGDATNRFESTSTQLLPVEQSQGSAMETTEESAVIVSADDTKVSHRGEEQDEPSPVPPVADCDRETTNERDNKETGDIDRDRGVRRSYSNLSSDSKPDPPSFIVDSPASGDAADGDSESPRGIDVLASHHHQNSVHITQLDTLQSQQYFISVPSKEEDQMLAATPDDEEMTEDATDSQRPMSVLLETVKQIDEELSDDLEHEGDAKHQFDDVSSLNEDAIPSPVDTTPYNIDHSLCQNLYPGPDSDVALLPRVDEHMIQHLEHPLKQQTQATPTKFAYQQQEAYANFTPHSFHSAMSHNSPEPILQMNGGLRKPSNGRRKIRLTLQEEVQQPERKRNSLLGHLRRRSTRIMFGSGSQATIAASAQEEPYEEYTLLDRGTVTVSWFEGTSSIELQEHVRKTVMRKLQLDSNVDIGDFRLLDSSVSPPEEILLCPFIPDGAEFLLRYTTRDQNDGTMTPLSIYSGRAPDSPSAAPSPGRSNTIAGLNTSQLTMLRNQLNNLTLPPSEKTPQQGRFRKFHSERKAPRTNDQLDSVFGPRSNNEVANVTMDANEKVDDSNPKATNKEDQSMRPGKSKVKPQSLVTENDSESEEEDDDDMMLHSEDPIEARLRQITEMLVEDRMKNRRTFRRTDKRQVVFMLANYFVLFLSAIAIFAEIQARLPIWQSAIEAHLTNVQDCAADKDALFKCVESGDLAGLSASVILYLSRSVATRRFFLLGFDSPKKLWTVVYEALVTSFCWGCSYIFIRRGMNPDTRDRFLQKYWKDAVYGSLAGFNAAFMKAVLKNLLPQEVVEDALRDRQLKILSWLPSFHK